VYPAVGRPQALINTQLVNVDIFLGIMSRRFGTPTDIAGSGTEEEFQLAYKRFRESGRPHILFYFSDEPFSFPQSDEELAQVAKVHAFRKGMRTNALVMHYTSPREFANVLRPELALLLQRQFTSAGNTPVGLRQVTEATKQQLRDLTKEYELIRDLMEPSDARTIRMETVVTRMRALAADIRPLLPQLKASQSPGERLAAVVILQVFPECTELEWLVGRFASQPDSTDHSEKPFLAYHAAEAFREAARRLQSRCEAVLRRYIEEAIQSLGTNLQKSDRAYVLSDALRTLSVS
jgi:hypothetical protein